MVLLNFIGGYMSEELRAVKVFVCTPALYAAIGAPKNRSEFLCAAIERYQSLLVGGAPTGTFPYVEEVREARMGLAERGRRTVSVSVCIRDKGLRAFVNSSAIRRAVWLLGGRGLGPMALLDAWADLEQV